MNFKEILTRINTFVFDVDGVLTNGQVLLMPNGDKVRSMNSRDGYAMRLAIKRGFKVCIITGAKSEDVRNALKLLGVTDIYLNSTNKLEVYKDYLIENDLSSATIIYMGDDIPDYQVMKEVALPCCPNDAATEIKSISVYISPLKGGEGCARDIIEQVLRSQDKWMDGEAFAW